MSAEAQKTAICMAALLPISADSARASANRQGINLPVLNGRQWLIDSFSYCN